MHTRLTKSQSSSIRSWDTPQRSSLNRCQRCALSADAGEAAAWPWTGMPKQLRAGSISAADRSCRYGSDTKKASALLALAKQHKTTPSIEATIWAGRASCMVRQGKPRAALKLLRKCSATLKSSGASNVERANGWLNESAAMSAANDHAGALGCAEKAAAILHEDIDKFETSVSYCHAWSTDCTSVGSRLTEPRWKGF